MNHPTDAPEKPKSRFDATFWAILFVVLSGGPSAMWAFYQELSEAIRQQKWAILPYWFYAYACVIIAAWLWVRRMKGERDEAVKLLAETASSTRPSAAPEVKREENLKKMRPLLDRLQNCSKWSMTEGMEHRKLAIEQIGPLDDEIKTFLDHEYPAKLDAYLGVQVSVPSDERFVFGFCSTRLAALKVIFRQIENEPVLARIKGFINEDERIYEFCRHPRNLPVAKTILANFQALISSMSKFAMESPDRDGALNNLSEIASKITHDAQNRPSEICPCIIQSCLAIRRILEAWNQSASAPPPV
jgi:hypothetical protein